MANFPRTDNGFQKAFDHAVNKAKKYSHKGLSFVLYTDERWPNKYSVTLESLLPRDRVAEGTTPHRITADESMIRL